MSNVAEEKQEEEKLKLHHFQKLYFLFYFLDFII